MTSRPGTEAHPGEPRLKADHDGTGRFLQWWQSDWGPGPLLALALPLMISAAFVSLTLFTDRTLLFWHSEQSASAAMGGGALYWTLICLPMGLLGYISVFVSQYRGAQQVARIGAVYQHAMALAWLIVPCLGIAMAAAFYVFALAGHTAQLAALEASYLRILLVGGVAVLFYSVQSGLLTGQGRTRTVLAIDAISTAINLMLDFVLIFGWGPIPGLGVLGAGLATAIAFWLKIPLAHWVIARDPELTTQYGVLSKHAWEPALLIRFIKFGSPAGLQMLAEAGCFSIIMLRVGALGEREMAATTLALGLNMLAFVPMIGLGIGVGVLVGQHLTEERVDLARRTVLCALGVTVLYTSFFALLLGLFPDAMVAVYSWGTPVERFEVIRPLLTPLLAIIAVYCMLDGLQVVFVGAIKGAGDTWFVLGTTCAISITTVCLGLLLEEWLGPSLLLWWYIIAGWVLTMGIAFSWRYTSGGWESKRVIEKRAAAPKSV